MFEKHRRDGATVAILTNGDVFYLFGFTEASWRGALLEHQLECFRRSELADPALVSRLIALLQQRSKPIWASHRRDHRSFKGGSQGARASKGHRRGTGDTEQPSDRASTPRYIILQSERLSPGRGSGCRPSRLTRLRRPASCGTSGGKLTRVRFTSHPSAASGEGRHLHRTRGSTHLARPESHWQGSGHRQPTGDSAGALSSSRRPEKSIRQVEERPRPVSVAQITRHEERWLSDACLPRCLDC